MSPTRPINKPEKQNFATLISAAKDDRICLVSTFDPVEARPAIMVCAVITPLDAPHSVEFVPLARLCDDNPYERYQFEHDVSFQLL